MLGVVQCDGGEYDQHWLDELFTSANRVPMFTLGPVDMLVTDKAALSRNVGCHCGIVLAEADARRIAEAVLAAM